MDEITLYVDNYDDAFNDFNHDDISQDLVEYIDLNVARTKAKNITINVITHEELSPEHRDRLIDSIKSHYHLEYYYNRYENKQMIINNIGILVIGILFLIFKNSIPMSDLVSDITDILGCFTMWSAIENILFTDYSQDSYVKVIKKVLNSNIVFNIENEE